MGRYRAVNQASQQMQFQLALNRNATFQVQANAGFYSVPLSGGSFSCDPSSGVLLMSGINNVGGMFSEPMQICERHGDHFHVMYGGLRWDLFPEKGRVRRSRSSLELLLSLPALLFEQTDQRLPVRSHVSEAEASPRLQQVSG